MNTPVHTTLLLGGCLLVLQLLGWCGGALAASDVVVASQGGRAPGVVIWQDAPAAPDAAGLPPSLCYSHWSDCISRDADRVDRCKLGLSAWALPVGRALRLWTVTLGPGEVAADSVRMGAHVTRPPPFFLLHSLG